MPVYVRGAGMTRVGRLADGFLDLARAAGREALADAGMRGVDHLFLATQTAEEFSETANVATAVGTELGLAGAAATRIESGPSSGASAVEAGFHAIAAGQAESALVLGVEKMSTLPTPRASALLSKMIHPSERRYGLTMPALAALTTRRWMHETRLTREQLALAPVKAHRHGAKNPRAQFQGALTVEEVLRSPVVASPLRVLDCAAMSDGAAGVVLSNAQGCARIRGIGHATDDLSLAGRQHPGALTSFRATRLAARRCSAMAKRGLKAADVVEMHDAFSVLELMNPVDLGLCRRDRAFRLLESGETSLGGSIPLNPSGGIKARGHPVGATGVIQVAELAWQLSGTAGASQVDGARVGVAHNIGGYGNNVVVTLMEGIR